MAVNITVSPEGDSPTEIQSTGRSVRTVNATIIASTEEPEVIESMVVTLMENEPNVTIINGVSSATIIGSYIDPFEDSFTFVEKGSSNLLEKPTKVIGVQNMPRNKDFYDLTQDTRSESLRHYVVTVTTDLGTNVFEITHSIYNEWEGIRSFVANYYS